MSGSLEFNDVCGKVCVFVFVKGGGGFSRCKPFEVAHIWGAYLEKDAVQAKSTQKRGDGGEDGAEGKCIVLKPLSLSIRLYGVLSYAFPNVQNLPKKRVCRRTHSQISCRTNSCGQGGCHDNQQTKCTFFHTLSFGTSKRLLIMGLFFIRLYHHFRASMGLLVQHSPNSSP